MPSKNYIGRFAPSPTGPLHFGSLVTAVASYYQAKYHNGQWLLRIEDIDKQRELKGAKEAILKTLEVFQLFWDGEVTYQSSRIENYLHAIEQLQKLDTLYRCHCSRKTIKENIEKLCHSNNKPGSQVYPGTCRNKNHPIQQPHSLRLSVSDQIISFTDLILGAQSDNISCSGDFVVQKMDGSITYQLAVAVDDASQNITEVVRGADLINSCSRQILILSLLNHPIPQYCHIPVVFQKDGSKLSKQTGAPAIDDSKASTLLWNTLLFLSQEPPEALKKANIQDLHSWALENWDITKISTPQSNIPMGN